MLPPPSPLLSTHTCTHSRTHTHTHTHIYPCQWKGVVGNWNLGLLYFWGLGLKLYAEDCQEEIIGKTLLTIYGFEFQIKLARMEFRLRCWCFVGMRLFVINTSLCIFLNGLAFKNTANNFDGNELLEHFGNILFFFSHIIENFYLAFKKIFTSFHLES